ncbi:MAG: ribosome recycling factor [Candidatus Pacebacteria bacterium]|nr:ribosome recycling factor [Candidatus Paceibacterota bacterium]
MNYDFSKIKNEGEKTKERFKQEASSLRTGRANPAIIEDLLVDSYGSKTPLKHLGTIAAEDARTLRVTPWDASVLKNIESAISSSNLGIQPIADKQSVRISLPPLTEDRRKALLKTLSAKLEEAKISLRQSRETVWKDIQEKERAGEIPEDYKFRFKDELQKIVDKFSAELEDLAKKKEQEIMS